MTANVTTLVPAGLRKRGEIEPVTPLDELRSFYGRFLYGPPEMLDTMTVWSGLTHVFEVFDANPRLAFMGPKNSGKSTALDQLKRFCARPVKSGNASPASVFAIIAQRKPTLLIEQTDTLFGIAGNTRKGENLRGILDDGYTVGGEDDGVLRMSGGSAVITPTYCPVAFGGRGQLPDDLDDRCVTFPMIKPLPLQAALLEEWDPDLYGDEARSIKDALIAFVMERAAELLRTPPNMPKGVTLRNRQIWKPLVSLGDGCSPEWGQRMRNACRYYVLGQSAQPRTAPGEELYRCIAQYAPELGRVITIGDTVVKPTKTSAGVFVTTGELIELLVAIRANDGRLGWAEWLDEPVTVAPRALAAVLKPYRIRTVQFTRDKHNRRGYRLADFAAWADAS